jgi:hypothetical protein
MTEQMAAHNAMASESFWDQQYRMRGGAPDPLPASLPGAPKQVDALLGEYGAAQQQRAEAADVLRVLREGEGQAAARDLDAAALAMRAGAPDPGPVAVTEHAEKITAAARKVATIDLLLSRVQAEVVAAVVKSQESWLLDLDQGSAEKTAEALALIDQLEAVLAARARGLAARDFIVRAASGRVKWAPGQFLGSTEPRVLAELRTAVQS